MHEDKIPEEIEEHPVKRVLKKVFFFLIGLFLVLLIVSYSFSGGYIAPIVASYFVSYSLDDNFSVDLGESKIIFDPAIYEELKGIYFAEQKNEFKVCLLGEKKGDYFVNGLAMPEQTGSFNRVVSSLCDKDTIITLHSHPRRWCRFSEQDIRSYEQFLLINPEAVLGLICDTNKFNFYLY